MRRKGQMVKRLTKPSIFANIKEWGGVFVFVCVGFVFLSCEKTVKPLPQRMVLSNEFWQTLPSQTPGEFVSLSPLENGWQIIFKRKILVVRPLVKEGWQVNWTTLPLTNELFSYAVVSPVFDTNRVSISNTKEAIVFVRGEEHFVVRRKDGSFSWTKKGKKLLSQRGGFRFEKERFVMEFDFSHSQDIFGLAEKADTLSLKGKRLTFYNKDTYKYQRGTDPLYLSIPLAILWETNLTVGVFLDNPAQSFWDMGSGRSESFRVGALEGEAVLYLFSSPHVSGVIETYTYLTGRPPLPPRWALGYQQSRFSYFPQQKVIEVANTFREKNLPADVIYLDIDFMDGRKSFTYDTNRFPDPVGLVKDLHTLDFRVVTIIDPGIAIRKGYLPYESGIKEDVFVKLSNGMNAQGTVWPGLCVFPDYTLPKTRWWWGRLYTNLLSMGFDGFWNDMNEPSVFNGKDGTLDRAAIHYDFGRMSSHSRVHNAYGLGMVQATYEGLTNLVPERRHFVLARAGYAGIQRYAFVWTGDNTASWDHLKLNLSMVLGLGLSGVPFAGADIGGYTGTPSEELFIRWMQMGVFLPFVRNHTEQGTAPQEPWAFGKRAEEISRCYLFARYRLLPLWYTMAYEAHKTGLPLVRPLLWEGGPVTDEAFLVGRDLVVIPVLESGKTNLSCGLPLGNYVEWKSHKLYSNSFTGAVSLEDIPVLVRRGRVLPLANIPEKPLREGGSLSTLLQLPEEKLRSTKDIRDITLWVFAGEDGEGELYWDDGESSDYLRGGGVRFRFVWQERETKASLSFHKEGSFKGVVKVPITRLVVDGMPEVDSVVWNGKILPFERRQRRVIISFSEEEIQEKDFYVEILYKGGKR